MRPEVLVEQAAEPRHRDPHDVAPEVDQHREHRAELDHRRERRARVLPLEQPGHDEKVRRAGDRQELGEPLDHAQHGRLHEVHCCGISFDRLLTGRRHAALMTQAA
jgi:hypothetical protein